MFSIPDNPVEFFVSGVPPLLSYQTSLQDLDAIASRDANGRIDTACEICTIGAVSYFEAFCHHQFAGIINIWPNILKRFAEKRTQFSIPVGDFARLEELRFPQVGSLVSEHCDFGSGKKINSLFQDLVGVTPFKKSEIGKHDSLLNDRNLLVHHGGIYTLNYQKQKFIEEEAFERVFMDSLVVDYNYFKERCSTLEALANKIAKVTKEGFKEILDQSDVALSSSQTKAIGMLCMTNDN